MADLPPIKVFTGNRSDCDATKAARDKLYGAPTKGVRIGGGIHVPMQDSWDGVGSVPVGWTGFPGVKDIGGGQYSVVVGDDAVTAKLAGPESNVLTAQEKTTLTASVAAAKDESAATAEVATKG